MRTTFRSHTCGELTIKDVNKNVKLIGWVKSIRAHGKVTFIDLADRYGITQIVLNDDFNKNITRESVIQVEGVVKERTAKNPNIVTGDIEVHATELKILSRADKIPIDLNEETTTNEELRLKYRYLDLRRRTMQENLILRHKVIKYIRDFLSDNGFIEVETPILSKSTPEGARDYLVPSRKFPGKFYALPQSPQQYKQLLMVAGFDRYFQIARCFRDEDLRADRQPEFTQLDLEMSFVDKEDIFSVIEHLIKYIFDKLGIDIKIPFMRMTYEEALNKYGIDKPDLRFKLEIKDVTDIFKHSSFNIFRNIVENNGVIKAINFKYADLSNKQIKKLEKVVKDKGAKGLVYLKYSKEGLSGTLSNFWEEIKDKIKEHFELDDKGIIFFVGDKWKTACESMGVLRLSLFDIVKKDDKLREIYYNKDLIEDGHKFLWITDFPLFSWSDEEQRFVSEHHPFTMPSDVFVEDLKDPEKRKQWLDKLDKIISKSYDIVLNGYELGSGSIRIHDSELQKAIFSILGLSDNDIQLKFGHMINAFRYGCPPHGGIALGLDRFVAILAGVDSIREVIAFPKNKNAFGPMEGTPSEVTKEQLDELYIEVKKS